MNTGEPREPSFGYKPLTYEQQERVRVKTGEYEKARRTAYRSLVVVDSEEAKAPKEDRIKMQTTYSNLIGIPLKSIQSTFKEQFRIESELEKVGASDERLQRWKKQEGPRNEPWVGENGRKYSEASMRLSSTKRALEDELSKISTRFKHKEEVAAKRSVVVEDEAIGQAVQDEERRRAKVSSALKVVRRTAAGVGLAAVGIAAVGAGGWLKGQLDPSSPSQSSQKNGENVRTEKQSIEERYKGITPTPFVPVRPTPTDTPSASKR